MKQEIYLMSLPQLSQCIQGEWHIQNLPKDASLVAAHFSIERQALKLVIESPQISNTPFGTPLRLNRSQLCDVGNIQ